jgi:PadR family transcriptional regulator PadR
MTRRVLDESDELIKALPIVFPEARSREVAAALAALGDARRPRLTPQQAEVMAAVLESDAEEGYGYELARACNAPTGSMYKVLRRLEERGLVQSRLEDADAAEAGGRPQRRLYALTKSGESELARWRAGRLMRSPSARLLR